MLKTFFTTRKLKVCLQPLKTFLAHDLSSKVEFSLHVVKIIPPMSPPAVQNLAMKTDKLGKNCSPVGHHLQEYGKEVGETDELRL